MDNSARPAPALLLAPRGAQLVGLVFARINVLYAAWWNFMEGLRVRRVAAAIRRHVEAARGGDVGRLRADLEGLNR